ncbi:AfsA-related hotdog domain-containing protein [Kiloniella laminariae]|uniref:AfsA-related hotdog domain-containing protein n=1 Tax=Kiloniella laminariae TaxID=454162 RepID=A0ABT4LQV1_9PROT|nr:AfsA-related hotdog domain-containing protein [Kiloniella laminariae]MCZ4282312.1 AfsA-related hotdog domain-containing protein [Kiloniella laminariae]
MCERIVVVVGDKFADFAVGKDVITLSQLKGMLCLPSRLLAVQGQIVIVPGQGLGDKDIEAVEKQASLSECRAMFDFSLWYRSGRRASQKYSHKHLPQNTLISEPVQCGDDCYELSLLIDENCELMSDHQTGQHVQGMILFEAARQTFLAVTETFYLPQNETGYYFVINQMSANYNRFAFPIEARITYRICTKDIAKANRMSFSADITVEQCNQVAATFHTDFTVFENSRISSMEGKLASQSLSGFISEIAKERQQRVEFLTAA